MICDFGKCVEVQYNSTILHCSQGRYDTEYSLQNVVSSLPLGIVEIDTMKAMKINIRIQGFCIQTIKSLS